MFTALAILAMLVVPPAGDTLAVGAHPNFAQPVTDPSPVPAAAALIEFTPTPTATPAPTPAPAPAPAPAQPAAAPAGYDFGLWRELVRCESGFNPQAWNPSSGASGAWQFLQTTWDWVSNYAGRPDLIGSPAGSFPLETQHFMAETLRTMPGGGLSHWVCGGYGS